MSKARIVSPEDASAIITWLQTHSTQHNTRAELLAAAFNAVLGTKPQPKINSSTLHRYLTMAGLTKKSDAVPAASEAPLDKIRSHERAIHDALLELDAERNQLTSRIKEIDDTIAKYRKI